MHSSFNLTAQQQKNEQAARIMELNNAKHERATKLANIIAEAVRTEEYFRSTETAEDYLARLGIDLTKI